MDGLLIIDKPIGPTSHDVVARMRRILRERRIGHTGTLDPMATGVLPLVIGRATRLAQFLSASDKAYDAVVALGYATDTGDADGVPIAPQADAAGRPMPSREAIERALDQFRGTFLQQPPVYSAKKIGGRRSHRLARATRAARQRSDPGGDPDADQTVLSNPLSPVQVTTSRLDLLNIDGHLVTLRVDCSAGFYVRSLAHDLGEWLGTGAHLAALRRTRSGDYTLDDAIGLDAAEREGEALQRRLVPLGRMLPRLPHGVLTPDGVRLASHGRNLGPEAFESPVQIGSRIPELESQTPNPESRTCVRLLDSSGELVGIARSSGGPGLLHPFVVLG